MLRLIVLILLLSVCFFNAAEAQLKIVLMHCGQGNAAFIQSPSGKSAVIDASLSNTEGTNLLSFVRDTTAYTKTALRHLDYTFLGHYHADHITGMDEVINGLTNDSILVGCYDRGGSYGTTAYTNYVNAAGTKRTTSTLGQLFDLGSGVTLRTVCMNGQIWNGGSVSTTDENTSSLGLLLTYGSFKMVISTDIAGANSSPYSDMESLLAPVLGRVTAMVVNHHGSATSSNTTWTQTLHPKISIISCATNSYGHPTATAINNLTAVDSNYIYQTQPGSGAAIPAGRGVITNSNIWLLVDSTSVTVHYGTKDSTYPLNPLAVEFAGMNVINDQDENIEITWRTESENNCYQWRIERSAEDQTGFCEIGTAPGRGTANSPGQYKFTDRAILIDGTYYYRLAQIDHSGQTTIYGPVSINYQKGKPSLFWLAQSSPNPYSHGKLTINYALNNPAQTSLKIFNILGQDVKSLINEFKEAGFYSASWDGRDNNGREVSNGIYYYRLSSGQNSSCKKLIIIR